MKILVTRFSAFGDVAMVAPVLQKLLNENKWISITLLTRPRWVPIFSTIERLETIGIDLKNKYRTPYSLLKYCYQLHNDEKFDFYIDLHGVLRTWILRGMFTLLGLKSAGIDKKRIENIKFIKNKRTATPVLHQTEKYLATFKKACITIKDNQLLPLQDAKKTEQGKLLITKVFKEQNISPKNISIGFAPFAAYKQKIWPLELLLQWVKLFRQHKIDANILFFGGGKLEKKKIDLLLHQVDNFAVNTVGIWSFEDEIKVVAGLDLMIGMDSGNVHLASIFGVDTFTIWGGTDKKLGFSPVFQSPDYHIVSQDSTLSCRPCSVFGNNPCHRGDWKCLNTISPEQVLLRLKIWLSRREQNKQL